MEIDPLNKLYVLNHTHEVYRDKNEPNRKFLESKLIGIFDSNEKALIIHERYKHIRGFKDSIDGLKITEYAIDSIFNEHINVLLAKLPSCGNLNIVYSLYYVFEYPDGYEDISLLGLFSSEAIFQKAKQCLICDSYFEKFSDNINGFQHQINTPQWVEGFIKWEPTSRENTDWNRG
jgi:hypothetical protein